MENYYKKFLVAGTISLCCAIAHLNANLLTGPYSPESQELVKLAYSSDMPESDDPIFKRGLNTYDLIISLKDLIKRNSDHHVPWIKDNVSVANEAELEAVIYILRNLKINPKIIDRYGISPSDVPNFFIAKILLYNRNTKNSPSIESTFKSILKNLQPKTKQDLLTFFIGDNASLMGMHLIVIGGDEEDQKKLAEQEAQVKLNDKHFLQLIVDTLSQEELNDVFLKNLENDNLLLAAAPSEILDMLLDAGVQLNFILNRNGHSMTALDIVNDRLFHWAGYDYEPRVKRVNEYLKAKGAKTYADLAGIKPPLFSLSAIKRSLIIFIRRIRFWSSGKIEIVVLGFLFIALVIATRLLVSSIRKLTKRS